MISIEIVRAILVADGGVTAIVAPDDAPSRLGAAPLAADVVFPALALEEVTATEWRPLAPSNFVHVRATVRVSGIAATRAELQALMKAVARCCRHAHPTFPGLTRVSVLTASAGPDGYDAESSLRMKSRDLTVLYTEPA
jgi:hypothetical protein